MLLALKHHRYGVPRDAMAARSRPTTRRVGLNSLWHRLTTHTGTMPVQAKLEVGSIHDREEEEADRLSETVMRKPLRDGRAEGLTASATFGKARRALATGRSPRQVSTFGF